MSWPNGGGKDLAPGDYYRVRFVAAEGQAAIGDEAIVVDHLLSPTGTPGCAVELGPWGEHGAPRDVMMVDASKLKMTDVALTDDERRRCILAQLTRDAQDMGLY